jgi:hypothetical protein
MDGKDSEDEYLPLNGFTSQPTGWDANRESNERVEVTSV